MLKKFNKIMLASTLTLALCSTLMLPTTTPAQVNNPKETNTSILPDLFGLSSISPEEIESKGISKPTTVWNIAKDGKYDFAGSSNHQTLYTNYKFTGKNEYTVYCQNTGSNPIVVTAKRLTKTYGSVKITAGKTGSFTFSNIQKDTEFYVVFESTNQSDFAVKGYVK